MYISIDTIQLIAAGVMAVLFLIVGALRIHLGEESVRVRSLRSFTAMHVADAGLAALLIACWIAWLYGIPPLMLIVALPLLGVERGYNAYHAFKERKKRYDAFVSSVQEENVRQLRQDRPVGYMIMEMAEAEVRRRRGGATHEREEDADAMQRLSLD